jgi:hypothetical protein
LSTVTRWRVIDVVENSPVTATCNMYSWSGEGYCSEEIKQSQHMLSPKNYLELSTISIAPFAAGILEIILNS